jgi:hypothetical protein
MDLFIIVSSFIDYAHGLSARKALRQPEKGLHKSATSKHTIPFF